MRKKNVTLNLKLSDARNVCSHLTETYSHNSNRDLSRIRAVRKLQGVIARAEQVIKAVSL